MTINEKLCRYIEENGIKQSYLAQKTGLSVDVISKTLNGNRRLLADEFLAICETLKIDPNIFRDDTPA